MPAFRAGRQNRYRPILIEDWQPMILKADLKSTQSIQTRLLVAA